MKDKNLLPDKKWATKIGYTSKELCSFIFLQMVEKIDFFVMLMKTTISHIPIN